MIEWIALVLVVPLIVVPIVLLVGFAGCETIFPLEGPVLQQIPIFDFTYDVERDKNNTCLIIRLEPQRLGDIAGEQMRLTIARPLTGDLNINAMFLSHAADIGNPYDAAAEPALVVENLVVSPSTDPSDQLVTFDPIDFAFDPSKPLLIALNIGDAGKIISVDQINAADGRTFRGDDLEEAGLAVRSPGYVEEPRIYLVTRIEV